jgi:hypothetical protein
MRQWIVAGEAHFQMLAAMMIQCLSTVMMKVPGSCYVNMVLLRFLSRAPVFLAFPPPPPLLLLALNLPCRLAAAADALSGMVISDLLLLL